MSESKKKKSGAVISTSVLLVGIGVASAYWTIGGTGTGEATTATTAGVTPVQTSVISDLGPGVPPVALSGNFTNTNKSTVRVSTVTASIDSVVKAANAPAGSCSPDDYLLKDAVMTVNQDIATGEAQGTWSGARLSFVNKAAVNQDGCKGATVKLTYTVS